MKEFIVNLWSFILRSLYLRSSFLYCPSKPTTALSFIQSWNFSFATATVVLKSFRFPSLNLASWLQANCFNLSLLIIILFSVQFYSPSIFSLVCFKVPPKHWITFQIFSTSFTNFIYLKINNVVLNCNLYFIVLVLSRNNKVTLWMIKKCILYCLLMYIE